MRSRFLFGEDYEVDPRAARVLQHGLQHLLQLQDDRPLLVALAPDPAQDDPHVDEVLLDVGDRGRVDQEVVDAVVPHLTAFTKSMLDEVGKEQEEEDQHAGSIYSGSNLCSSGPSLHTIFAKNPFPRELPHPVLKREDRLGKEPFAGFCTLVEDITGSGYTKNQPILLGPF